MQDFIYNSTDSGEILDTHSISNPGRTFSDGLGQDLKQLLSQLVASVDNQLFLLADKSQSIDEQNQYLALMHLFHINKQELIEFGAQQIRGDFHQLYLGDASLATHSGFYNRFSFNWSNDSKQQYELEKQVEALWHKLHKENHEYLKQLNDALNALFCCHYQDVDFPLSALSVSHVVANLFIKVCNDGDDAALVMQALTHSSAEFGYFYLQQQKRLSLFDSEVTSTVLQHNGANVDVKIKSYRRDSGVDQINQDLLAGNPAAYAGYAGEASETISPDMELCLTELQSVFNLPGSKYKQQTLYDIISDRLSRQFSAVESEAINLVDNLFIRIMAEKSLPHAVRNEIENLKVPCVKLALDQSRLFTNNSHPIIGLIDMIAESALLMALRRGEPDEDDPMLVAIRDAVQRLCFGYTDDDTLVEDINATLRYRISQYVVRNKEQYEKKKDKKISLVNNLKCKLHQQNVPPIIARFVREIWYKVLNTNIDAGAEGLEDLQHFLDDLIWSVQPKHLEQEKRLLLKLIPGLIARIRDAVSETCISEDKCERFIAELEQMHIFSLQGRQANGDPGELEEYDYRQETIQLEKLEPNSWVRYLHNQRAYYLRLDHYNEFSREYSFVDSAYQKIVVMNKEELANCLNLGEIELHAEHSLFSRSLRAVA